VTFGPDGSTLGDVGRVLGSGWRWVAFRAAALRAGAVGAFGGALLLTWVVVAIQVTVPVDYPGWYVAAAMVPCLAVSVLLLARLPGAAVTRVVTTLTLCHLIPLALDALRFWDAEHGGPAYSHVAPAGGSGIVASASSLPWWLGTLPLLPVLLVVFPDGVPRRGLWQRVFWGQVLALVIVLPVLVDQADGVTVGWLGVVGAVAGGFALLSGVARGVSLVRLWYRAKGERRGQLLPFVAVAGALSAFYAILAVVFFATGGLGSTEGVLGNLTYAFIIGGLPAAIGWGVLRHRLFGIQVVVNRVAVAVLLSVMLFGVYAATSAGIAALAGGDEGLRWEPLLAAGVAVAALGPLFRLARLSIDRVMFGDRDRPDRAVHRLATRLGATVDPLEVPQTVVDTVADAMRLPVVAMDLETSAGPVRAAARGPAASEPSGDGFVAFPITYAGVALASLLVAPRTGERVVTTNDRAVLSELAAQAGPALFAGRLTNELAASRERLRQGRLEERSRLRRALHDGVSPTLSGIAIAAAAAGGRDPADPAVRQLLRRIEEEAGTGAVTLHALLDGLRPPGLAGLGLLAAIEQRATGLTEATGVRFDVHCEEPVPALDPDVEQVAYLVTVEAMVNVARHAAATDCDIALARALHHIKIDVSDNGMGLPADFREGDGLRSAQERATSCGGVLVVSRSPRGGTRVAVQLPLWTEV